MANYYEKVLKQKEMALNLMKKGFKATFGFSFDEYEAAAGACEEIQAVQTDIDYYKAKIEETTEAAPTEKGEENG